MLGGILLGVGGAAFWIFSQSGSRNGDSEIQREVARMLKETPEAEVLGLTPEEKKK
ncbi:MAG: hypothetical protein SNJ84_07745 [Verrucomicrobiia bacterium]